MGRRRARHTQRKYSGQPIAWFPIDSRLFPFFSFSHVRGAARIFLMVEMVLSVSIVVGSLILAAIHFIR